MTGDVSAMAAMSILYAKAYGIYFIATGLAIFLNPTRIRAWYQGILNDKNLAMVSSTFTILIGSFILATHHLIVADWHIIITLIGYWGVVVGTAGLVSDKVVQLVRGIVNNSDLIYRVSGIAWLLLGVFLVMKGYNL